MKTKLPPEVRTKLAPPPLTPRERALLLYPGLDECENALARRAALHRINHLERLAVERGDMPWDLGPCPHSALERRKCSACWREHCEAKCGRIHTGECTATPPAWLSQEVG